MLFGICHFPDWRSCQCIFCYEPNFFRSEEVFTQKLQTNLQTPIFVDGCTNIRRLFTIPSWYFYNMCTATFSFIWNSVATTGFQAGLPLLMSIFINILWAALVPICFCQKNSKPNCNLRKAAQSTFVKKRFGFISVRHFCTMSAREWMQALVREVLLWEISFWVTQLGTSSNIFLLRAELLRVCFMYKILAQKNYKSEMLALQFLAPKYQQKMCT